MSEQSDNRLRELEIKQERQITLLEGIVERNKKADKIFADHIEHEEPYHHQVASILTKFNTLAGVFSFIFILAQLTIGAYLSDINLKIKDNRIAGQVNARSITEHVVAARQDGIYVAKTLEEVKELIQKAHDR